MWWFLLLLGLSTLYLRHLCSTGILYLLNLCFEFYFLNFVKSRLAISDRLSRLTSEVESRYFLWACSLCSFCVAACLTYSEKIYRQSWSAQLGDSWMPTQPPEFPNSSMVGCGLLGKLACLGPRLESHCTVVLQFRKIIKKIMWLCNIFTCCRPLWLINNRRRRLSAGHLNIQKPTYRQQQKIIIGAKKKGGIQNHWHFHF
jgi:hypothetical protein